MDNINSIGRRKTSVARLYMTPGKDDFTINGQKLEEYFESEILQIISKQPFEFIKFDGGYEIKVNVKGGGFKGQAEAVRMGISRILVKINEDNRKPLKDMKFLSRDARVVERKKYGKPKARKSFQFSKR